jgi:hypothetical protein
MIVNMEEFVIILCSVLLMVQTIRAIMLEEENKKLKEKLAKKR